MCLEVLPFACNTSVNYTTDIVISQVFNYCICCTPVNMFKCSKHMTNSESDVHFYMWSQTHNTQIIINEHQRHLMGRHRNFWWDVTGTSESLRARYRLYLADCVISVCFNVKKENPDNHTINDTHYMWLTQSASLVYIYTYI